MKQRMYLMNEEEKSELKALEKKVIDRLSPKKSVFDGLDIFICNESRTKIGNQKVEGQCVYFIVKKSKTKEDKIMYIGSSNDFRTRFSSHEKVRIIKYSIKKTEHLVFYVHLTADNRTVEKQLIFKYKPPFNSKHTKWRSW